jgi:hypothetical protein
MARQKVELRERRIEALALKGARRASGPRPRRPLQADQNLTTRLLGRIRLVTMKPTCG